MNNENKNQEETKPELAGNVIVITVGCAQCPINEEYRIFSAEEAEKTKNEIGKVVECPNCKGQWLLKRIQMRGVIIDAEKDAEEWRVAPLYVPILTSFNPATMHILDVPMSLLKDDEEE